MSALSADPFGRCGKGVTMAATRTRVAGLLLAVAVAAGVARVALTRMHGSDDHASQLATNPATAGLTTAPGTLQSHNASTKTSSGATSAVGGGGVSFDQLASVPGCGCVPR
ncbi:hypothetical protein OYC58_001754 [Cutibacterium acnes]|nr:hypothetical protein OYC58_001754 [Cutibacterium acnes]